MVDLATVVGAVPLLDQLLNIAGVYRFREHDGHVVYDVTYLSPQTTNRPDLTSVRRHVKKTSIVPVVSEDILLSSKPILVDNSISTGTNPRTSKSCLD